MKKCSTCGQSKEATKSNYYEIEPGKFRAECRECKRKKVQLKRSTMTLEEKKEKQEIWRVWYNIHKRKTMRGLHG